MLTNPLQITYLEEYYLTNDEIEVLKSSATDIVKNIPSGVMIIELGSGSVMPPKLDSALSLPIQGLTIRV